MNRCIREPYVQWCTQLCLFSKVFVKRFACLRGAPVSGQTHRPSTRLSAALLSVRSDVVSSLHWTVALSPCGCLHSLLLLLRLPVRGGKSKCECKCVGFVCTVVTIAGFTVRLQFYFQTSSDSNLSKLQ